MKIFVSFSSQDRELVTDLTSALKSRGADVWTYFLEMKPGDSLIDKINEGISSSDYIILVVSEHSIKSHWVTRELNAAMMLEAEGKIKIIPILIDGSGSDLPPLLKEKIYADFRTDFATGFRELRSALGLADMTEKVIHQTAAGERLLGKNELAEEGGMKVFKRDGEIYVDIPSHKQHVKITDEEAELRTEHFTAKWDNIRNQLTDLKIDWSKYHPTFFQTDILEMSEQKINGFTHKKYICKFGAEFTLIFDPLGIFVGLNANKHCQTTIDVKTKMVTVRPAIPTS